jgi:hypothetical protein
MGAVHLFGIRHHGPGSSRRLIAALDALQPGAVLIEGPADLSDVLPALADPRMVPPVALLAYAEDTPEHAVFWPFAVWSPEYQAVRWATRQGVPVSFIDLPAAARFADSDDAPPVLDEVARDPLGALAKAAGYEDGESWWSDVIEENPDPTEVFAAVAAAMTALREGHEPPPDEARREAHMRRATAAAAKATEAPVAVVCGAWHVPALATKVKPGDDAALLKGLPKAKVRATWVPWTLPRLARATGYGAGVPAPGWYRHLWDHGSGDRADALWLARIARLMREAGDNISTASVIEAVRLGQSLAGLRGRPAPGFAELRDAAVSAMMGGEALHWRLVERRLLLGNEVGEIPPDLPLAPLLEDLQDHQRRLRMKPEALERELSLDLRTDGGLERSTLLHRLTALGVPWGKLASAGKSRGTFRENWVLAWQPDHAVALVENLVYGPTIAGAAAARMAEAIKSEDRLPELADRVQVALVAQLPDIAAEGVDRLSRLAAGSDDGLALLATIPALVDTLRYGTARALATDQLAALLERLILQSAVALPMASRGLDAEAAARMHELLSQAQTAIAVAEPETDIRARWIAALTETAFSSLAAPQVAGLCARLAQEQDGATMADVATLLSRRLSRAHPAAEAAAFFEGFFRNAALKLAHNPDLRRAVDDWLLTLDDEAFTETLPLLRRVFAALDSNERKRLLGELLGREGSALSGLRLADDAAALWDSHLAVLGAIFDRGSRP